MRDDGFMLELDEKHFLQFAENTARQKTRTGGTGRARRQAGARLAALRRFCTRTAREKEIPVPAAEWLLDNWHVTERSARESIAALRAAGRLPVAAATGLPMVSELAAALCRAGGAALTSERLASFLAAAQRARPLSEKELSVFLPALRLAVVAVAAEGAAGCEDILARREREDDIFHAEVAIFRLAARGEGPTERLLEQKRQADAQHEQLSLRMRWCFQTLRALDSARFPLALEEASAVEGTLRRDPAGVYARMDEESRARYRARVTRLAKKSGITEAAAAERAVALAAAGCGGERHVGYFLFTRPLGKAVRKPVGVRYVGTILLLTLFFTLFAGYFLQNFSAGLLVLLPVWEIVKNCVDTLAVRFTPPRGIPRLELPDGVPQEGRTLCVITTLLTDEHDGEYYVNLLEEYRLANRDAGEQLLFGILADLPDGTSPTGEKARRRVDAAAKAVAACNARHKGGFLLLFRPPVFQTVEERYMGWERKRGALLELTRLIMGRESGVRVYAGDKAALQGVKFVITLDADTSLTVGAAKRMIGAMLHPLNRPKLDRERGVVVGGYGILQPRVSPSLPAADRSRFSRIYAGQGGVDPYGSVISDVYHDLFDQGSYIGKGIFDIEVFFLCLDGRFPENRILSHDLLEGAYLRAGFLSDVELTDGYPYKVVAYFARLHRWIRGDWQILPWIGRKVRTPYAKERNPVSALSRFKIFDNLRRSLTPGFTLAALLLGMIVSGRIFAVTAAVAALSAASRLLITGAELALRPGVPLHTRYHSGIMVGPGGAVLRTLLQLLLLPYQTWVSLSAVFTALFRMFVIKKKLLDWTTASDAEKRGADGLAAVFLNMLPAAAAGAAALLFSQVPAGRAVGAVWMLAPVFAWRLSRPIEGKKEVPEGDRAFLLHHAALIWGYFRDHLTARDHYLPPDNVQEAPAPQVAHRTSPTNIALAFLSVVAASDLELCRRDEAAELLEKMLGSLERLEKWHGQPYNWYDTRTLRPLRPRYVSSVDSGNLCAALIALRETLREWNEPALSGRAGALADAMELAPLYDRTRRLFSIGFDVDHDRFSEGCYDLMASEARQTSYLAVARGEVPPKHWRQLSRALVAENDYCGMASWTGTMFEYLMPGLLLPVYPNSLLYESAAFCVYVQRRHGAKGHVPWGVSESGFYAFDPGQRYQYKAHGVQKLALRRGMDEDLVVAPYASFLALAVSPAAAAENLRRLARLGAEGKYGFYEAVDFTPSRCAGEHEIVRSYMAHHLGMSLVAVDNALGDNVMQRRFLRDPAMNAFRELLQEKVPVGAVIMRDPVASVPERARRVSDEPWRRAGEGVNPGKPRAHLLSNGSYTVSLTDTGFADELWEGISLARCTPDGQHTGISFFVREGEQLVSLTAAPLYAPEVRYGCALRGADARFSARWAATEARLRVSVAPEECGALREVELFNRGEKARRIELLCCFEPVLASAASHEAHPAFSDLFLAADAEPGGLVFRRAARETQPARSLAFFCDREAVFETSRAHAMGRFGLAGLLRENEHAEIRRAPLFPCVLARVTLTLPPRERAAVRFSTGAAETREDACRAAQRILRQPAARRSGRLERIRAFLELSASEAEEAMEYCAALRFPPKTAAGPQRELWAYGISGDYPILAARVEREGLPAAARLLRQYCLLRLSGAAFDLALLCGDGGDYHRPLMSALRAGIAALGCEMLLGARAGIHLVEAPAEGGAVAAHAAVFLRLDGKDRPFSRRELPPPEPLRLRPHTAKPPETEYLADGAVRFTGTPETAWSQILANPRFGALVTDRGLGHLWRENARENQLTPWSGEALGSGGAEALTVDGESPFEDARVTYGLGWALWEKEKSRVTAFVPPDTDVRVLLIEAEGETGYRVPLRMGATPEASRHVRLTRADGAVLAENAYNEEFPGQTAVFLASERWNAFTETGDGFAAKLTASGTLVLLAGAFADGEMRGKIEALRTPDAARAALAATRAYWETLARPVRYESGCEALDRYLNGWALYQVVACRLWARTSLYQNGGAYGFRDQLQDACALSKAAPALLREQLLRAAAHQFAEGDVQHWWHPNGRGEPSRGVRTRYTDDLLWLPYALCVYVEETGDRSILDERVPYLVSPALGEEEDERYELPEVSPEAGTLLEHARRAIELVLGRGTGEHGLCRMGGGDWNDGMNRVAGESVWLTQFFAHVLGRFAALTGNAEYRAEAERFGKAANGAWDGAWFLRGYYADGRTLGSAADKSCRMDAIAQGFAALAPGTDRARLEKALKSALRALFDRKGRLVKLFAPPFSPQPDGPGYIQYYPPGIRENGGQYTHGAVWLALGCLRAGFREEARAILEALLPSAHDGAVYRAEPYVLAADVYANPEHYGRGGWTWYTGAAGWYYRVAAELLTLDEKKEKDYNGQ